MKFMFMFPTEILLFFKRLASLILISWGVHGCQPAVFVEAETQMWKWIKSFLYCYFCVSGAFFEKLQKQMNIRELEVRATQNVKDIRTE